MELREDLIEFPENSEESWRQYFAEFREKVWPMLQEQGLTFSEALFLWQQERIVTKLTEVIEELSSG